MFSAFRFGIPAVYGEVGGPQIRPRNPAPEAANNPPTAVEANNNPPNQIPPNHHDVGHNDDGHVRNFLLLLSYYSLNPQHIIYTPYSYDSEMVDCFFCIFLVPLSLYDYGCWWSLPITTCTLRWRSLRWQLVS